MQLTDLIVSPGDGDYYRVIISESLNSNLGRLNELQARPEPTRENLNQDL